MMSDRAKIALIYSVVAAFVLLVAGGFYLGGRALAHRESGGGSRELVTEAEAPKEQEFFTLEADLEATNQEGERVRVSDLGDKVWLAVEFYANCPQCAQRNADHLVELYRRYRDREDFHVVCFSVDPEHDTIEHLRAVAEVLGADSRNWWFLTAGRAEMHRFLEHEMKFFSISERTDPLEIEAKGRYAHDLGIAVMARGLRMVEKKNLFEARQAGQETYERYREAVISAIDGALERP